MDTIRSSLWSALGALGASTTTTTVDDGDLPCDLIGNLAQATNLIAEVRVAERNLGKYQGAAGEFASAACLLVNDITQLCTAPNSAGGPACDLIAKAADLQALAETKIVDAIACRVVHPLTRWKDALESLVVKLDELKRMHQQARRLAVYIKELQELRVRQVKTNRWTAT